MNAFLIYIKVYSDFDYIRSAFNFELGRFLSSIITRKESEMSLFCFPFLRGHTHARTHASRTFKNGCDRLGQRCVCAVESRLDPDVSPGLFSSP